MFVYSMFRGNRIDDHNKSSAELTALCDESDAAFVAAIEAFSMHNNPSSQIRRRRIQFLMRFKRSRVASGDESVWHYISHSDQSSIAQEFRIYIEVNWSRFFH